MTEAESAPAALVNSVDKRYRAAFPPEWLELASSAGETRSDETPREVQPEG